MTTRVGRVQHYLPEGDEHTSFQVYNYPRNCTVVFFKHDRASATLVPFFADHEAVVVRDHGHSVFYTLVPYDLVTCYLATLPS